MKYIRKTEDIWVVQGNYGQGWEDVSAYEHYPDAHQGLREYRDNETQYPHRVRMKREPLKQGIKTGGIR